jgi:hypothetical protein
MLLWSIGEIYHRTSKYAHVLVRAVRLFSIHTDDKIPMTRFLIAFPRFILLVVLIFETRRCFDNTGHNRIRKKKGLSPNLSIYTF